MYFIQPENKHTDWEYVKFMNKQATEGPFGDVFHKSILKNILQYLNKYNFNFCHHFDYWKLNFLKPEKQVSAFASNPKVSILDYIFLWPNWLQK